MANRTESTRIVLLSVVLLTLFAGLAARMFFLHLEMNSSYTGTIGSSQRLEWKITARRGQIMDCNGNLLALDLSFNHICADPERLLKRGAVEEVATALSKSLPMSKPEVLEKLNRPGRRYVRVYKYADSFLTSKVRELDLAGVFFEEVYRRHYPGVSLMSHVIGFANNQGVGSAGLEIYFDDYLTGEPGLRIGLKDARQSEIYTRRKVEDEAVPGDDLYLTLDQEIQHSVEGVINNVYVDSNADSVWAIVQRVETGEILAMASSPTYNLNEYGKAPALWRRNNAIGYIYEPGSTMKAITIASALEAGLVETNETIECGRGVWYHAGRPLHEYHGHAYGALSVADVLKKSSNIGTAKIALRLGERRLERFLRFFGFGRRTGIELPGEENGILRPREDWSKLSITRLPMGHEIGVTALQMLNGINALANGGVLMRPYVVKKVVAEDGKILLQNQPEPLQRVVSEGVALKMQRLMRRVTERGGTATRARVEGYAVAGKTGTTQKIGPDGHYLKDRNLASFVGFAPADNPEISIIVVVDDPEGSQTGGQVAAPAFNRIASHTLRCLNVKTRAGEEYYFGGFGRD